MTETNHQAASPPHRSTPHRPTPHRLDWIVLVVLLLIGAARFYASPSTVGRLSWIPDEPEPVVAAQRLVTLGRLDIPVAGRTYPSRYPPLFALLLTPAYAIAPQELGAGVVIIWMFAIGGVACAYAIGRALAGMTAGGALAASAVMFDRLLVRHASHITTDLPAAVLALGACGLFLRAVRGAGEPRARLTPYLLGGITIAVACGMRVTSAPLLLPWLALIASSTTRGRVACLIALLTPPLIVFLGNAVYQQHVFGDWRRTGYQFWCPVPYDYFSLVFSPRYITSNLVTLHVLPVAGALAAGAVGAALLAMASVTPAVGGPDASFRVAVARRAVATFVLLGVVPISLVFLFYCFPYTRFHDGLLYFGCVYGGAGAAAGLRRWGGPHADQIGVGLAIVVAIASLFAPVAAEPGPPRRAIAVAMAQYTPDDAVLITGVEDVYLEPNVLRGTRRVVLPYNRTAGYALTPVAWRKVPNPQPPPRHYRDHRNPGILAGGAIDVHELTAMERPDYVLSLLRGGRPVYLDMATSDPQNPRWSPLLERVRGEQVPQAPFLARLVPR